MAVSVAYAAFDRVLERTGDRVLVLFRPSQPTDVLNAECVRAVAAAIWVATEDPSNYDEEELDEPRVPGGTAVMTPHGPVASMDKILDPLGLRPWLERVAAELTAHGWAGELTVTESEYPPIAYAARRHGPMGIAAVLCLDDWTPRADASNFQATAPWRSNLALAAELADWAVDWTTQVGGALYLSQHLTSFRVTRQEAVQILTHALVERSAGNPRLTCDRGDTDTVRRITLTELGRLIITARDVHTPWNEQLQLLLDVVRHHAHRSEAAFVRQAPVHEFHMLGVVNAHPQKLPASATHRQPSSAYRHQRDYDATTIPDAYGVMLLNDHHLHGNPDLRRWNVTHPARGKHLLIDNDLPAWFAETNIDPDTITAARSDLHDLILWEEPSRRTNDNQP